MRIIWMDVFGGMGGYLKGFCAKNRSTQITILIDIRVLENFTQLFIYFFLSQRTIRWNKKFYNEYNYIRSWTLKGVVLHLQRVQIL